MQEDLQTMYCLTEYKVNWCSILWRLSNFFSYYVLFFLKKLYKITKCISTLYPYNILLSILFILRLQYILTFQWTFSTKEENNWRRNYVLLHFTMTPINRSIWKQFKIKIYYSCVSFCAYIFTIMDFYS